MYLPDLTPLRGKTAEHLGLRPLAVGYLHADKPFTTGPVPDGFLDRLLPFLFEQHSLPGGRRDNRCSLSRQCPRLLPPITRGDDIAYLDGQIRVLGKDDIFAAPSLIYHYITDHNYRPPDAFVDAVMKGAPPGSTAHRALIRTLLNH